MVDLMTNDTTRMMLKLFWTVFLVGVLLLFGPVKHEFVYRMF